ncbi:hypothetical protein Bbelb_001700 [Branchiostoma belcheri]|nr:hypothetical protein Bbelb_001700 [Branchiostoma belcheri]
MAAETSCTAQVSIKIQHAAQVGTFILLQLRTGAFYLPQVSHKFHRCEERTATTTTRNEKRGLESCSSWNVGRQAHLGSAARAMLFQTLLIPQQQSILREFAFPPRHVTGVHAAPTFTGSHQASTLTFSIVPVWV